MNLYKIKLKILTPSATPWQSDTLFGHICWQVALGKWEQSIKDFLEPFLNGEPSFVLSDGFPDGLLPRPMQSRTEGKHRFDNLNNYSTAKELNKAKYLAYNDFINVCRGQPLSGSPVPEIWSKKEILHAAIDRNTGTTSGEGSLYQTEVIYLEEQSFRDIINIYLLCKSEWKDKVVELLNQVSMVGYGKDKSVGCGRFAIQEIENADELLKADNQNGFTTLSSYIPSTDDPTRGRWKIRTKRGKLGEGAGGDNPFKTPLIQFEPGAVFAQDNPDLFYGRMIRDIAPGMPEAVQCCYTIAIPMRLDNADPLLN